MRKATPNTPAPSAVRAIHQITQMRLLTHGAVGQSRQLLVQQMVLKHVIAIHVNATKQKPYRLRDTRLVLGRLKPPRHASMAVWKHASAPSAR